MVTNGTDAAIVPLQATVMPAVLSSFPESKNTAPGLDMEWFVRAVTLTNIGFSVQLDSSEVVAGASWGPTN